MSAVPRIFLIMVPIQTNHVMMGFHLYIKQLYQVYFYEQTSLTRIAKLQHFLIQ
jgi:hypothetical protein